MGLRSPGFEVFSIRECGTTSNACFCVREVWQDFTRVVVLCYLAKVQISTAANTRRTCQFEMLYEQNVELTLLQSLLNSERNNI